MFVVKEKTSGTVLAICSRFDDAMAFFSGSKLDKIDIVLEEVVSNELNKD